jgi:CBS domain-containing protein
MPVGEFIGKLHALAGEDNPLREDQMALARAHPLFRGVLKTGEMTGGRLNVTISPKATLLEVIRALARNRVHRVYAVSEEAGAVDRVVTHSDLVRFFAMFAPSD